MIVQLDKSKCSGCGLCVDVCPVGAIRLEDTAAIDAILCNGCGACIEECPNQALFIRGESPAESSPDASALPSSPRTVDGPSGSQQINKGGLLRRVLDFFRGSAGFDRGMGSGRGQGMGGGRGRGMGGGQRGRSRGRRSR